MAEYIVHTDARIYVQLKTKPEYTVSCSVWEDFPARKAKESEWPSELQPPPKSKHYLHLIALGSFKVFGLSSNPGKPIYPPGTCFYAWPTVEAGVERVVEPAAARHKEVMVQDSFL